MLHILNLGRSFITLREPCNNQLPRCDIAWLRVTNYLYHGFPSLLATGWWFSPVFSTNKTDIHDITEILLKMALSTIKTKPN